MIEGNKAFEELLKWPDFFCLGNLKLRAGSELLKGFFGWFFKYFVYPIFNNCFILY